MEESLNFFLRSGIMESFPPNFQEGADPDLLDLAIVQMRSAETPAQLAIYKRDVIAALLRALGLVPEPAPVEHLTDMVARLEEMAMPSQSHVAAISSLATAFQTGCVVVPSALHRSPSQRSGPSSPQPPPSSPLPPPRTLPPVRTCVLARLFSPRAAACSWASDTDSPPPTPPWLRGRRSPRPTPSSAPGMLSPRVDIPDAAPWPELAAAGRDAPARAKSAPAQQVCSHKSSGMRVKESAVP